MAKIGHIAIRSAHPGKAAEFFKQAFGFREVHRFGLDPEHPEESKRPSGVALTDGTINLTFLNVDADNLACPEDFMGIQHFGIIVDDVPEQRKKLEAMGHPCIIGEERLGPNSHYEIKFRGPDEVVFDISYKAWPGTRMAD